MSSLVFSAGDWANIVSALASFFASVVALVIAFKKPKKIIFEFLTGGVFNHEEYYEKWSIENIKHILQENKVTINFLRVNVRNIDIGQMVILESGIIVKGDFKKQKFGNYLTMDLHQNVSNPIDFGNDLVGVGHIVSLQSHKLNPFISNRSVSFKVYVKDSRGKIYKSETFKIDDFN